MNEKKEVFKILSIDGGGIRGIFSAHILKRIQEEIKIEFHEEFDLIAGTSTGSIISAALAINIPINTVEDMYKKNGREIFKKNPLNMWGLFKCKYKKNRLEDILRSIFKSKTLSETLTRLIIPSTDIANGCVHVFKSNYCNDFVRDKNVELTSAVLSSCSAPVYFNPNKVNEYLLADGGLWANNPALVALSEALGKRLNIKKKNIRILSIGTGIGFKYYDLNDYQKNWGLVKWGKGLIDTIMNLQSMNTNNQIRMILGEDNYLRLNFESDSKLSLDDYQDINYFLTKADKIFTYEYEKIKNFLGR